MKKRIALLALATVSAALTSNARADLSGWGAVTQIIVLDDEVRIYTDLASIPNPGSCISSDSVGIELLSSPSIDNYEPMVATALSALAGNLEVRFNTISAACTPSGRPRINQIRLRQPS